MWIQVLKMRVKPGKEELMFQAFDRLRESEKAGSGLIKSIAGRNQKDPSEFYTIVMFESEEAARVREGDSSRIAELGGVRDLMSDALESGPEFVDLEVVAEYSGQ